MDWLLTIRCLSGGLLWCGGNNIRRRCTHWMTSTLRAWDYRSSQTNQWGTAHLLLLQTRQVAQRKVRGRRGPWKRQSQRKGSQSLRKQWTVGRQRRVRLMEAVGQSQVHDGDACSFSDAHRFRYSIWWCKEIEMSLLVMQTKVVVRFGDARRFNGDFLVMQLDWQL